MSFQGQLTECLFVDPTILILILTFYKIDKNDLYILKHYVIFFLF
jgi:hypothetical protein